MARKIFFKKSVDRAKKVKYSINEIQKKEPRKMVAIRVNNNNNDDNALILMGSFIVVD